MEIESILGDEDLAIFSEALFGQEEARSEDQGKYGLGDLLTAFKKGVDEQLDESDTESHYSLGIAYKEMGLYDEAVEEFRAAARDTSRSADCSCLEGLCWRDKGDMTAAEDAFKEGLALPVISAEALLNLKYELAMLYELSDRTEEAISLYSEIMNANIYFRDVSDRLANLADNGDLDILEPELLELDEEH
jgi:tetratricopeptide (TPR) repeat protein